MISGVLQDKKSSNVAMMHMGMYRRGWSGVHDLRGVARQEAEQRNHHAQGYVQEGKGALQQGVDTVQDALRQGIVVATQRLQQFTTTPLQQPIASQTN
jgi:hypothetical protein